LMPLLLSGSPRVPENSPGGDGPDMTCRDFVEFLIDYLSGGLSADERARFEAHLAECEDCMNYLRTYQDTIRLARGVLCAEAGASVPPDVPEELLAAIVASRRLGS
jgi:anti-sigma factor RsiW